MSLLVIVFSVSLERPVRSWRDVVTAKGKPSRNDGGLVGPPPSVGEPHARRSVISPPPPMTHIPDPVVSPEQGRQRRWQWRWRPAVTPPPPRSPQFSSYHERRVRDTGCLIVRRARGIFYTPIRRWHRATVFVTFCSTDVFLRRRPK